MNKLEGALATCTDEELGAAFRTALEFPLGFKGLACTDFISGTLELALMHHMTNEALRLATPRRTN